MSLEGVGHHVSVLRVWNICQKWRDFYAQIKIASIYLNLQVLQGCDHILTRILNDPLHTAIHLYKFQANYFHKTGIISSHMLQYMFKLCSCIKRIPLWLVPTLLCKMENTYLLLANFSGYSANMRQTNKEGLLWCSWPA